MKQIGDPEQTPDTSLTLSVAIDGDRADRDGLGRKEAKTCKRENSSLVLWKERWTWPVARGACPKLTRN